MKIKTASELTYSPIFKAFEIDNLRQGVLKLITAELLTELQGILSEKQVAEEEPHHLLGNGGTVKVTPYSEEEISAIIKYANKTEISLNIEGGGTKKGFGGLNESADLLLSMAEYNGIVEHVGGDMTLTVKAGTNFKKLQDYLAAYNQRIPLDPFYPEAATIGGVVAANDSGPKRLGLGSSRDAVIGLRIVYPDGKVIRTGGRVVKNVAGYDMNKLFIGSMGTLGILTEVSLKLRPLPKEECIVFIHFPLEATEAIKKVSDKLLNSIIEPVSLELLNPALSKRLTGENCFTLAVSLEDVAPSIQYQETILNSLIPAGIGYQTFSKKEARSFWQQFYAKRQNPETASLKIGVLNMDVVQIVNESHHLGAFHHLEVEAHGGLGHGLCQVTFAGESERIVSFIHQLRSEVTQLGGYAVVTSLPFALRKKVNVWGELPSHFFLLQAIKAKLDPKRILNPKRFVGGI